MYQLKTFDNTDYSNRNGFYGFKGPEFVTKRNRLRIDKLMKKGIIVKACKGCADEYGVSDKLNELGINVKYMGQELTDYIKNGNYMITF